MKYWLKLDLKKWYKAINSSKGKSFHLNAKCLSFRFIYSNYSWMLFQSCLYDDCHRSSPEFTYLNCWMFQSFTFLISGMLIVPCSCIRYTIWSTQVKIWIFSFKLSFWSFPTLLTFNCNSGLLSAILPRERQSHYFIALF